MFHIKHRTRTYKTNYGKLNSLVLSLLKLLHCLYLVSFHCMIFDIDILYCLLLTVCVFFCFFFCLLMREKINQKAKKKQKHSNPFN